MYVIKAMYVKVWIENLNFSAAHKKYSVNLGYETSFLTLAGIGPAAVQGLGAW